MRSPRGPFRIVLTLWVMLSCMALSAQDNSPFYGSRWDAQKLPQKAYAAHSVLAGGNWFSIGIRNTGIYKISYQDLLAMGFTSPIEGDKIRVFGHGGSMLPELTTYERPDDLTEVPRLLIDGGNALIDQADEGVVFYAEGPVVWVYDTLQQYLRHYKNYYTEHSVYFINYSGQPAMTFPTWNPVLIADTVVKSYIAYQYHELDSLNLMKTGKVWFGEVFNQITQRQYSFHFPDADTASPARIRVQVGVRSLDTSYFKVSAGDTTVINKVNPVDLNVNTDYCKTSLLKLSVIPEGDELDPLLEYLPFDDFSTAWLNYIEAEVTSHLRFRGGVLAFRNPGLSGHVLYEIEDVPANARLWRIAQPWDVREIPLQWTGTTASFTDSGDTVFEYVVFDESIFNTVELIGSVPNQDLHATAFPDMIIISHPDFMPEAQRLADFRRNTDGYDVLITTPREIYNEFSSGQQDPTAIRDFIRMLYVRAEGDSSLVPHYILLFGDGSYDYLDRLVPNSNYVPTYQTYNSWTPTASFVSDDYFVLLDVGEGPNASGLVDAAIGRLPAETPSEAAVFVDKILRYSSETDLLPPDLHPEPWQISNFSDWRNDVCFIADDEDGNLHLKQAEILAGLTDSLNYGINLHKIYLDAYQQEHTILGPRYPGANDALQKRMRSGALLVNYTGHGGETGLAEEGLVDMAMIEQWDNFFNLPVFVTASCEFSRYDNPAHKSAGEHVILNPGGGAISILSTTRVAFAHSNMIINTNVIRAAFDPGSSHRLGDIVMKGKVRTGLGVYIQNFTLLGDPAMKLAFPEYDIRIDSLNGDSIHASGDSLLAAYQQSLVGSVRDKNGIIISDFSGLIQLTVFDKPETIYTLANDPFSYSDPFISQTDVVYRGLFTVKDGVFRASFTLPADVSFRPGNARISMYAKSVDRDACATDTSLRLINTGINPSGNGQGPEIALYLNDRSFRDQGLCRSDARLIADIQDEDGINYYGAGFGHDLMMILDDDLANPVMLNDYFQPLADRPDSGNIAYPLMGLAEGQHQIRLRAWDVLNYPGEAVLDFYVSNTHDISLNHLSVFPNPSSDLVYFCFDRNETALIQWVQLTIKSTDGRTLYSHEEKLLPGDGIQVCTVWDGSDNNASAIRAGIYIYTVKLLDAAGAFRQYTGKLVRTE